MKEVRKSKKRKGNEGEPFISPEDRYLDANGSPLLYTLLLVPFSVEIV